MPLYEYNCKEHGLFEQLRPSGLSKHPAPCHACGKLSPRAYSMAPNIERMDPARKRAIERNIKSQFEPHICGAGCGHEHHGPAPSSLKKPKVQQYTGPRSWVIEHAR